MSAPNNRVEQSGCADRHASCFERVAHGRTEPVGATTSGVASKCSHQLNMMTEPSLRRGTVEEEFGHGPQTLRRCRIPHLAPGQSVDEEPVCVCLHGFGDRTGEHRIVERHHVEGTMQLHVMQLKCHGPAEGGEGAQLVEDIVTGRRTGRGRSCDARTRGGQERPRWAPTATPAAGSLERSLHHARIAGVEAAATSADATEASIASSAPCSQSPKLSPIRLPRSIRRAPAGVRRSAGAARRGRPGCRAWRAPGTAPGMS
jgi:hypothetical protein